MSMQAQLALVTQRPGMKARYAAVGVAVAVYPVQEGGRWPEIPAALPIVLDTVGMPSELVLQLLAWVPDTVVVIAAPENWRTLRLVALSRDVQLVVPPTPEVLQRCLRYMPCLKGQTCWLLPPAPPLVLSSDPDLLLGLDALHAAPTLRDAAAVSGLSVATLTRQIRQLRQAVGLPLGQKGRLRPAVHAAQILARLGEDRPLYERELAA